jgi:hypothetical protein
MYQIKATENKDFIYVAISDKINHIQIIQFLDIICNTPKDSKTLLLITDYRNAVIDEKTIDPIEKIGVFFNTNFKSKFTHIKWANISLSPLPTTGAIILHELIKGDGIEYEPFGLIENALHWLNLTCDDLNRLEPLVNYV